MSTILEARYHIFKTHEPKDGVIEAFGDIYTDLTTNNKNKPLQSTYFRRQARPLKEHWTWRGKKTAAREITIIHAPEGKTPQMVPVQLIKGTTVYITKDEVRREGAKTETKQAMLKAPTTLIMATGYGSLPDKNLVLVGGIRVPTYDPFWGIDKEFRDSRYFSGLVEGPPGQGTDSYTLSFRLQTAGSNLELTTGTSRERISRLLLSQEEFEAAESRPSVVQRIKDTIAKDTKRGFPLLERFLML